MTAVRCQTEPTLRRLDATVLRCEPAGPQRWAVELDQTILYPEGGGQPADHGSISGVTVVDVQRDGDRVVHLLTAPVAPGPAEVRVDWARRFDHMQQHSAQHLLSALAEDRFGKPTIAFHLGEIDCTVDLAGDPLPPTQLRELESAVNDAIREARPVSARLVSKDDYATLEVRSRGLPAGHTGSVRLVEIDGIDCNTCGGTHVAHTGELQAFVLRRVEKVKGGSRLVWQAGDRVRHTLRAAWQHQDQLNRLLTTPPAEHAASVERLLADQKRLAKARQAVLRELATHLGRAVGEGDAAVVHVEREGADLSVLRAIADAALRLRPDLRLLLTGDGVFMVAGPAPVVQAAGPDIAAILDGRGGGRGDRYQGKAARLGAASEALQRLRDA